MRALGQLKLKIHSLWSDLGEDLVLSLISRPGEGPPWSYRSVVGGNGWTVSDHEGVRRFETTLKANGQVPPGDLFPDLRR